MAKEILCTLGPASMNKQVIRRLEQLGVSLFRINLSHTAENDVANAIDTIAVIRASLFVWIQRVRRYERGTSLKAALMFPKMP